jgi:hypothetical protein
MAPFPPYRCKIDVAKNNNNNIYLFFEKENNGL